MTKFPTKIFNNTKQTKGRRLVFYDFKNQGFGKLICFDLDTKKLITQENLEQKRLESNLI